MPIPRVDKTCSATSAPSRGVSLPVLADPKRTIRRSKMGPRRAAVLIAIHIFIIVHVLQWMIQGRTITPVEPSESMYTINSGELNAGFVFFAAAILSTLILGRFFCGWGCHLVALQDLCSWLMKRVGVKPKPFRSRLMVWAPVILAVYMFAWPTLRREVIRPVLGAETWAAVAPYIGEAGVRPEIKAAFVTERFWETFPPWYIALPFLALCTFASVYFLGSKGFCTYGCPYGGIFGPVERLAAGRIRVTDACEHCGHCTAVCTSNVRVHEEVRDYGMVMDPGCMKCMDCVSVCPNDALYFGFGAPSIAARARTAGAPRRFKSRVYDLSLGEELAYGGIFLLLVVGYRGMLGMVPLLMAMGFAGIGTFLLWKLVSMARLPNVRVQSVQLKLRGSVRPAGFLVGMLAILTALAGAWGAAVNASLWRGHTLDAKIGTPLDEVLTAGYRAGERDQRLASRAAAHLRRGAPVREGGIGWDRSVDRSLRLARLDAIMGNLELAEGDLRQGLANSAASAAGPSAVIEDSLIRVLMLRSGGSLEALGTALRRLNSEYPGLASVQLSLARVCVGRGEQNEAIALIRSGIASKPGDVRNLMFASELLVQLQQVDMAVEVVREGVRENPNAAVLRERLGLLLAASGRVEEGLAELKEAARLEPDNPSPAQHIGALLREAGKISEATEWEELANTVGRRETPPKLK